MGVLLALAQPQELPGNSPDIAVVALCPCLALLPAGVTWPAALLRLPVVSYTAFSPLPGLSVQPFGGLFLWPDPTGCPVPGVTRRRALWSADFPQPCKPGPRSPDQPGSFLSYYEICDLTIPFFHTKMQCCV